MKKSLFIAFCFLLFIAACTKEFKDASFDASSASRAGGIHPLVTSLKGVLAGLVNRNYSLNVKPHLADYYAPTSKPIGQRPLYTANGIVVNVYWQDLQSSYNGSITANNAIDSLIKFAADSSQYAVQIKIRVFGGLYAPSWVKTDSAYGGGTKAISFQTTDDDGNPVTGSLPKYWDNGYINAFKQFMVQLASKYDTCVNVLEVTAAVGDITTVEPCFLRCGLPGTNLNYPSAGGTAFYQNAVNLYNAGLTSANHSYAIRRGISIMDSTWQYTHRSLCFSPFQVLTRTDSGAAHPSFSLTTNIDSSKHLIDYFVAVNGLKGVMGNNGLRDAATMPTMGSYADWVQPSGDMVQICNYMKSKLFTGSTRNCYLYFQTVQADAIGDFDNTLDTALAYNADMVETPYLSAPSSPGVPTSEKSIPILKHYDSALVAKSIP